MTSPRIRPCHPQYQLRHNTATIFKGDGLEVARVVMGHGAQHMTQQYGDENRDDAIELIKRIG